MTAMSGGLKDASPNTVAMMPLSLATAALQPFRALLATLLQGLHFVWHRKMVLGAISLDLFALLFGVVQTFEH